MCDDDRARVLDIRLTAAAPHPVTLRYNGAERITRGRTAITVRGFGQEGWHPHLAVQRNNCGGGETSMPVRIRAESLEERDGDHPDEWDP